MRIYYVKFTAHHGGEVIWPFATMHHAKMAKYAIDYPRYGAKRLRIETAEAVDGPETYVSQ